MGPQPEPPASGAPAADDRIAGAATSITAFVGRAPCGPLDRPVPVGGFAEYEEVFGGPWREGTLGDALRHYFAAGGREAVVVRVGEGETASGLRALAEAPLFNLLCIPPPSRQHDVDAATWEEALATCRERRAILLVDPPARWSGAADVEAAAAGEGWLRSEDAALYFPRIRAADPLDGGRPASFAPSGAVAGVIARSDAERGVWSAPSGAAAVLQGVEGLAHELTGREIERLSRLGVNCLRSLPAAGPVVWGARTTAGFAGSDAAWQHLPVRRLALFVEESVDRGTRWAASEPNGEPLWLRLRSAVEAFLDDLFRRGAFQGRVPGQAYFVRCDGGTTTAEDVERGIVRIVVGFAPARPAEFVRLEIRQIAGPPDGAPRGVVGFGR